METATESKVFWFACLAAGAPSNAATPTWVGEVYSSEEAALNAPHWANQAPWAAAYSVEVPNSHCHVVDGLDRIDRALDLVYYNGSKRARKLLAEGKNVAALEVYQKEERY